MFKFDYIPKHTQFNLKSDVCDFYPYSLYLPNGFI